MNLEDIIRMARESGLAYGSDENILPSVRHFFMAAYEAGISVGIALGTATEREACAKVCNDKFEEFQGLQYFTAEAAAKECESVILARGKDER